MVEGNGIFLRMSNRLMSQEFLKWLAIISMVVDHVSEHLLFGCQPGRAFGRLAFPLFAMFVTYNYTHYYQGRFPNKYILRLVFFGICTQVAYVTFGLERLNIMATLSLGLLAMFLYCNGKYCWLVLFLIGIALFNHFVFSIEYGLPGVLLLLFLSFDSKLWVVIPALLLIASPPMAFQDNPLVAVILPTSFYSDAHTILFETSFALAIAFVAICYMYMRPGTGRSTHKYFFYAFYPTHLSIILAIGWYLSR
jgi:hypothetical protein